MRSAVAAWLVFAGMHGAAAQYEPYVGQPGKDVIWVPTPRALVEKMLDMARVTPRDYLIDLGSGDGRNVIAAAKRGAQARGIEYEPEMVKLSKRNAAAEGVAGKATFVQGDMYQADISKATVLALFLLPANLQKLTPKLLALKPGSRIVSNGYEIPGWQADEKGELQDGCGNWCTAYLYLVPASVAGRWQLANGVLDLEQKLDKLSGSFASGGNTVPIGNGRIKGLDISFTINGETYAGRVDGERMSGSKADAAQPWSAVRALPWH